MRRFLKRAIHFTGACCILILPLAYYPGGADSTQFAIGASGGVGQVATVLRDCSGKALASESAPFKEAGWSAYLVPSLKLPFVIGVRSGYYEIDAKYPIRILEYPDPARYATTPVKTIRENYVNPHFSIETKRFGIGVGYIYGDIPVQFDDTRPDASIDINQYLNSDYPWSENRKFMRMTGHLRLGRGDWGYFFGSLGESSPILAPGFMTMGLAYPFSTANKVRGYTAFTALFYERPGFLQEVTFKAGRNLDIQTSVRLGGVHDKLEGAFSAGFLLRLPHR